MCNEEQIRQIVREELTPLREMLQRHHTELEELNEWSMKPEDYRLHKDLPPGTRPRTIKQVVHQSIRESIEDAITWQNILKVTAGLSVFLTIINQIVSFFGGGA